MSPKKFKYDFVIITPGRSGSDHLTETLNNFDDVLVHGEVFNRANYKKESFNTFLNTNYFLRLIAFVFNREKLSRFAFNFPLLWLVYLFLNSVKKPLKGKMGFKLSLDQLKAYPFLLKMLLKNRTQIVYLNREDKLAQVLSLIKSRQTGVYYRREKSKTFEKFSFDLIQVKSMYNIISSEEQKLFSKLNINGVEPFILSYECLFKDYPKQLHAIRAFLNLPSKEVSNYSGMTKINPAALEDWVVNLDEIRASIKS